MAFIMPTNQNKVYRKLRYWISVNWKVPKSNIKMEDTKIWTRSLNRARNFKISSNQPNIKRIRELPIKPIRKDRSLNILLIIDSLVLPSESKLLIGENIEVVNIISKTKTGKKPNPPCIAIGFECHLSDWGCSKMLYLWPMCLA